ncbi:MAG: PDZ domain-containing protein [Dehalococcoidia bacterium]
MDNQFEDRFEATLVLDVSADDAWAALTGKLVEGAADGTSYWLPGFEAPGDVLELDAGRLLRVRKAAEPCKGTEILFQLEASETGTRVTVVQSGFPAWVKAALEDFTLGWHEILADIVVFLEHGVRARRHAAPWASTGLATRTTPGGLAVVAVSPGSFGERAGIEAGDLLLKLRGGPMLSRLQLQTMMRACAAGEEIEAIWVRGRERMKATAAL